MVLNDYRLKQVDREEGGISALTDDLEKQEELVEQLPFPDVPLYTFPSVTQTPEETATEHENEKPALTTVSDPIAQRQPREMLGSATLATQSVQPSNYAHTVIIPSTGKKSAGTMRAPKGRSRVIHLGVCVALVAVVVSILAAVLPADTQGHSTGFGLFQPIMRMVSSQKNETALIAAQAATATAVTQDGYEYHGAGANHPFAGVNTNITPVAIPAPPAAPASSNAYDGNFSNPFSPGQCTWWADYRYHELTGFSIPWTGNANEWSYNASGFSGWVVSETPRVPSIVVLQPGVQYASGWGHVAIVERVNSDGSVYTSNYNVLGWGVLSYATYRPTAGVSFVYHV